MASNKSNLNIFIWAIGIIAVLAFLGVVYLIVKDNFVKSNDFVLVGDAIAPINENPPSPLASCTKEYDRGCESNHGAKCRGGGFWGAQCKSYNAATNTVICECYHAA